jgi:type II secretory pathway predicted ATPase ExeA
LLQYAPPDPVTADALAIPNTRLGLSWREKLGHLARPTNPYPGLLPFAKDDAARFFGRTSDVARVNDALKASGIAVVVGASGVGKSSLVRAGVVPGLDGAAIIEMRPGVDPWRSLALALLKADRFASLDYKSVSEVRGQIRSTGLGDWLVHLCRGVVVPLLFVDQAEELRACEATVVAEFVGRLLEAADPKKVKVVVAIRADHLEVLTQIPDFSQRVKEVIPLSPLSQKGLREAIEEPARRMGVKYEIGLVDAIVNDASRTTLPVLQFFLSHLWHAQLGQMISFAAYHGEGQISGALDGFAEDQLRSIGADEDTVRRALIALVAPNRDGVLRRSVRKSEVERGVWEVIERLDDARLVCIDRVDGATVAELAHEALTSEWQRLARLTEQDREFLVWLDKIRARLGSSDHLTGVSLEESRTWIEQRQDEIEQDIRDFISASIDRAEVARREKEARILEALAGAEPDPRVAVRYAVAALRLEMGQRAESILRRRMLDANIAAMKGPPCILSNARRLGLRNWSMLRERFVLGEIGGDFAAVVDVDGSVWLQNEGSQTRVFEFDGGPIIAAFDGESLAVVADGNLHMLDVSSGAKFSASIGADEPTAVAVAGGLGVVACSNGARYMARCIDKTMLEVARAPLGVVLDIDVWPGPTPRIATLNVVGEVELLEAREDRGWLVVARTTDRLSRVVFEPAGDYLCVGGLESMRIAVSSVALLEYTVDRGFGELSGSEIERVVGATREL